MASFKKIRAKLRYRAGAFAFRIKLRARIAKTRLDLAKWKRLQRADKKELAKTEKMLQGKLASDERARLSRKRRVLTVQIVFWNRDIENAAKELALARAQLREFKDI